MEWGLDTSPIPRLMAPTLDADQQRVVDHRGGPLLVLAGPGTGKTTTLVEAVVARLTDSKAPLTADQILVLTFGRRAAGELRDRIAARLGGGLLPTVATFHSFAYGFVQQGMAPDSHQPRLLSGAEEDVRIRDLIMGSVHDESITWPEDLLAALPTLGFANEVRAVLSRARRFGLQPADLVSLGGHAQRPAWQAVGQLAEQDDAVMAFQEVMDYTDLLVRAIARAREPGVARQLHKDLALIVVDEYQDTDPLQVQLLKALAGPHATVIAVGDPDQGIYGFRGADIAAVTNFAQDFPGAAEPIVLRNIRRFGPNIKGAARHVLSRRAYPGIPADIQHAHRATECTPREHDALVITRYASASALAAGIAENIAHAHIERQVPWQDMAILTRTAADMAAIQQALSLAHIPATIARDDIPLRLEPAVATILQALRSCIHPDRMSVQQTQELLTGPLCGLDAVAMRRWGRAQRRHWQQMFPDHAPPPASELIRAAVLGSEPMRAEGETLRAVEGLQRMIQAAHQAINRGASPAEVLWIVWSGQVDGYRSHEWPERLRSAALRGSATANHDLDAVMALFDSASRFIGRNRGAAGIGDFVDSLMAQELPAEPVAERGPRPDAVRLLTAHRAKGLEWDEVWVVGLQEGIWPDIRPRGSVLEPERLSPHGLDEPPSAQELLDEERRLLYVACTRGRNRVTLCVIDAVDEVGDRPSRFIDELTTFGVPTIEGGLEVAITSLPSLVATLRNALTDESLSPFAAELLAHLAQERDNDGEALVPWADPATWWGTAPLTPGVRPLIDPTAAFPLSGSTLETLRTCPRRWFLERKAHAEQPKANHTVTGSIIHSIAEFVGRDELPNDIEVLDQYIDRVWSALRFDAPWQSAVQRAEARDALERFCAYHREKERRLIDSEIEIVSEVVIPGPDGSEQLVRLRGVIDRLEQGDEGTVIAVDLKTQRTKPTNAEVEQHAQLGLYQYLLRADGQRPGGAELVQLRHGSSSPVQQLQPALPESEPTWVELQIGQAASTARDERFWARINKGCGHCQFKSSCPAQVDQVSEHAE
jgi:superfamily I DNA/RNA helicase/RecB family exonuclease